MSTPHDRRMIASGLMVANILAVYDRRSHAEQVEGRTWYLTARELAWDLARSRWLSGSGPSEVARAAGVLAALSPQKRWGVNVTLARRAFDSGRANGHTATQKMKAQSILDGASPWDVLTGPKERAFAAAIFLAGTRVHTVAGVRPVVIDRHAVDVAEGQVHTDRERPRTTRSAAYTRYVDAYVSAADEAMVSPTVLQTTTWLTWRNDKTVMSEE